MTDFKNLSLEELEEKGISDLQIKLDPKRINLDKGNLVSGVIGVIGGLSLKIKISGMLVLLLFLFGIANVPIYIWYFFVK